MADTGYFHLHLVSDATGETLITVARAAAAQYANVSPVEHLYPMVRSKKQLDRVLDEISEAPGLVLYTLLEEELIQLLERKCREIGVPCMSVLGPILQAVPVLSRRRDHPPRRRAARAQCRIFPAHRRAQFHHDA